MFVVTRRLAVAKSQAEAGIKDARVEEFEQLLIDTMIDKELDVPRLDSTQEKLMTESVADASRKQQARNFLISLKKHSLISRSYPTGVLEISSPWGNERGSVYFEDNYQVIYSPGEGDEGKTFQDYLEVLNKLDSK